MKTLIRGIAVAAVLVACTNAYAGFNIPGAPSAVDKAADKAAEMGLEQAASDVVKKYNCRFANNSTTSQTVCNNGKTFSQMVDELRGVVHGGNVAGKRVALKAEVEGTNKTRYDRRRYIRSQLERIQKWYRISVYDRRGSSNRIDVSANAY